MIPAIKPNKKYTGGVRLCPDILGDRQCPGVLQLGVRLCSDVWALVDCTGQLIAVVDCNLKMVDSCLVGQGCVPWKLIHLSQYLGNVCNQQEYNY